MKNNLLNTAVLLLTASVCCTSCKKDFETINTNPNALSTPSVNSLFTFAEVDAVGTYYFETSILNCAGYVQHFATYKATGYGDKYLFNNEQGTYFSMAYQAGVNDITETINAASKSAADINKLSVARIWRVYIMHRLTDLFGDVPYTEAAKGYTNAIFTPKYDSQQSIYQNLFKELDEAINAFDAGKATYGAADVIYQGSIDQWKKFGYSLMLRLGMRLTKVDAATAKTWVQKAIAGGVIVNEEDRAYIQYSGTGQAITQNPITQKFIINDYAQNAYGINNIEGGKYAKTLIDFLKNNNDPRLPVMSVVWKADKSTDSSAAVQKGMPNGLFNAPADLITYSEPNPATILQYTAPLLVLTNAETNLLLAEAVARGWYNADAATLYQNGVSAAMHNWALFGVAGNIAASKISVYLAAHPYQAGSLDAQLNQIHTQMWAALVLDEIEAYSNWRRTGYPILVPVNYTGNNSNGTIPRRFMYPLSEVGVNTAHYNEAVARQGADLLTTRVWWDKQ